MRRFFAGVLFGLVILVLMLVGVPLLVIMVALSFIEAAAEATR